MFTPTHDVFPRCILSDADSFSFYTRHDVESNKHLSIPFIPLKESKADPHNSSKSYYSSIITYYNLQKDFENFLIDRFNRLYNDTYNVDERSGKVNVKWSILDSKMCRPPHLGYRYSSSKIIKKQPSSSKGVIHRSKNADIRLGYVIQENCFLVKSNFTFGLRKPDKTLGINPEHSTSEVHVIRTTEAPLLLHVPKPQYLDNILKNYHEGSFFAEQQDQFDTYVLPGKHDKPFIIPHGVPYILTSVQKTLFYLYRCTGFMVKRLRYNYNIFFSAATCLKYKLPNETVPETHRLPQFVSTLSLDESNPQQEVLKTLPPHTTLKKLSNEAIAGSSPKRPRPIIMEIPSPLIASEETPPVNVCETTTTVRNDQDTINDDSYIFITILPPPDLSIMVNDEVNPEIESETVHPNSHCENLQTLKSETVHPNSHCENLQTLKSETVHPNSQDENLQTLKSSEGEQSPPPMDNNVELVTHNQSSESINEYFADFFKDYEPSTFLVEELLPPFSVNSNDVTAFD